MLTAAEVISRRSFYLCCSHQYLSAAREAAIYGDAACEKQNNEKMLYMYWAAGVMCRTPVQDGETGCLTIEFASEVASSADCYCDLCGCLPAQPPFDNQCEVEFQSTALDAVNEDDLPVDPAQGDAYYLLNGADAGDIATWDGADWAYTEIALNDVVLVSSTGDYYTNPGNGPGLLFPPIDGVLVAPVNQYEIVSSQPQIALNSTRSIAIQGYVNNAWVVLYSGIESVLSSPTTFDFIDLPITSMRILYIMGPCSYVAGAVIEPPFGGCGFFEASVTPVVACNQGDFSLNVDITVADLWPIGDIVATVDGTPEPGVPGQFGVQTIGPFPSYSTVGVVVQNANNPECNYDAGEFNDTTLPIVDIIVSQAVDASFESGADPDTYYLIVSDTENSMNSWATHVGQVVYNATFTVPDEGSVIYALDPGGPSAYWQAIDGEVVRVFAPLILEYSETTLSWSFRLNAPLATGIGDVPVEAYYDCGGGPTFLFSGIASEMLIGQPFDPECGAEVISGYISYSYLDCVYEVQAEVTEYEPGGEVDPEFSTGGLNEFVQEVRFVQDGKFLVCGNFTAYGITPAPRLTRLNVDGTLDTVYNTALGTGLNNAALALEIDASGNALVGGLFTQVNGVANNRIVRMLPDGTRDTSFVIGTGFNGSYVQTIVITGTGTIIAGGLFTQYNGNTANRIAALNPDGTVDTSWAFGSGFDDYVQETEIDNDGNLICVGPFNIYKGTNLSASYANIARILPDGTLDGTLVYSTGFNDDVQDIAVLPDGRLMFVGEFTSFNGNSAPRILMLNPDGTRDTAFMANIGVGFGQSFQDIRLMPNGQIMIGGPAPGQAGGGPSKVIRLNADGTRDMSFSIGSGPNADVRDIALDTNGSLVIGGSFVTFNGITRLRVVRII